MMEDEEFYLGIISALAVVNIYNLDTLFDEIVGTTDLENLVKVARKNGHMRWSGLSEYLRRIK